LPDHQPPSIVVDPPPIDDELRLVVLGDWGSGQIEQWQVAQGMESAASRLGGFHAGLMLGDNFYPAGVKSVDDPLWKLYFEQVYDTTHLARLPWYALLGNHDYGGNARAQIEYSQKNPRWIMPAEYWSHEFKAADGAVLLQLIAVDTNKEFLPWPKQMAFLDAELARARGPVIVAGHHPIYTAGNLGALERVKNAMRTKLVDAKVAAYLAGHEHNHQLIIRGGLTQLIQGGGGKRLTGLPWKDVAEGVKFALEDYGFSVLRATRDGIHFDWCDRHGAVLYTHAL